MKKSNRTVRKMRSAWTGFTTACLAAALTMSALVSCAPQESRPVVTSDDLTPEGGYAWLNDPWPWELGGND